MKHPPPLPFTLGSPGSLCSSGKEMIPGDLKSSNLILLAVLSQDCSQLWIISVLFLGQPEVCEVMCVNPPTLMGSWTFMFKCSRLESGSETSSSQNSKFFWGKTKMFQSPSAIHASWVHHIPVFAKGEEWATFPLAGCDLPVQGKGWCTSDRNGWESTQAAWPLMGTGTCAARTGKARNGNFKTQMFHPGQDYCHGFPWDQPTSLSEFTSLPFISLERGSLCRGGISPNWAFQAECGEQCFVQGWFGTVPCHHSLHSRLYLLWSHVGAWCSRTLWPVCPTLSRAHTSMNCTQL